MIELPVKNEETQKTQVDPETAERVIVEKRIGERIKCLRLKKSMGLVELGRHTGLSASFLSQLETGRVCAPCATWRGSRWCSQKICRSFLRASRNRSSESDWRDERVRMPQTGVEPPTYFFESLGYLVPDRYMDPYFAEFIPLAKETTPSAHA